MVLWGPPRYVVNRLPGPGTCTGEGDILIDNQGGRWRVVSDAEAQMMRQGTMVTAIATLYPNGTIG